MPIITIARGTLWGGQTVAQTVARSLGAPCLGREALTGEALNLTWAAPEGGAGGEDALEARGLWDRVAAERTTYIAALQAALAGHAAAGDLVYHGLAGHILLGGVPSILRVRIIAPLEMRIAVVVEKEAISRQDAEQYIERVDGEWTRWTRFIFGVDWHDPSLYDLVINLENLTVEGACDCILEASRRPEFAVTEEVRQLLRDLALASRVKLALALTPASRGLEFQVKAHKGVVSFEGVREREAPSEGGNGEVERMLATILSSVQGVREVQFQAAGREVPLTAGSAGPR